MALKWTVEVDYTPRRAAGDDRPGGLDMEKTTTHRVRVEAPTDHEARLTAAQMVGAGKGDVPRVRSDAAYPPGEWPQSPWHTFPDGMVTRADIIDWEDPSSPAWTKMQAEAAADSTGVMVALVPPDDVAGVLMEAAGAVEGITLEPESEQHLTLLYLGDTADVDRDILLSTVAEFADHGGWRGLQGHPNGWGIFANDNRGETENVLVALWDIPFIAEFRADLYNAVHGAGLPVVNNHGFTPHETMAYSDEPLTSLPPFPTDQVSDVTFAEVIVAYGGDWQRYPLSSGHDGEGPWHTAAAENLDDWRPHAGMFAPGQPALDPRFFDTTTNQIRPDVRKTVLGALDTFLKSKGYTNWMTWMRVYLTGSGASYWWDSDHDMDILIELDLDALRQDRPQNDGVDETDIDAHFDHLFKTELDPQMANTIFAPGEKPCEVTYFVNPGADIIDIKPYAAYDLINDTWIQRPPKLPADWGPQYFGDDIWRQCEEVARAAQGVLAIADPEARHAACVNLFDWLHHGRQIAYGPNGKGWLDIGNVEWQYLSQRPDRLLQRLYAEKHATDIQATAGPGSDRIPRAMRAVTAPIGRALRQPRKVVLDRPASDDLSHLPPDVKHLVAQAILDLQAGKARLEVKARELAGAFTVRLTNVWRMGVYLGKEGFWHAFWIGDHNYDEAERRFGSLKSTAMELCPCCNGTGEHDCGHECYSCDASGQNEGSGFCEGHHGTPDPEWPIAENGSDYGARPSNGLQHVEAAVA